MTFKMKLFGTAIIIFLGIALISLIFAPPKPTSTILSNPMNAKVSLNVDTSITRVFSNESVAWTIMVYMDVDNDGDWVGLASLNEMEAGFATDSDVEVVLLIDRNSGFDSADGDWTGARYYHVLPDDGSSTITSEMCSDLGEVNMGHPNTLRSFVTWAQAEYPAEKQALIMCDHGRGVSGLCWDFDNNGDHLTLEEVQQAMDGLHVDLFVNEACVMGLVEVAYEWRTFADYFVASENFLVQKGLDYEAFLQELCANPSMEPWELGESVARTCLEFFEEDWYLTQSVINCSVLSNVVNAFSALSNELSELIPADVNRMAGIRQQVCELVHNTVDIGSLISVFRNNYMGNQNVSNALAALELAYDEAILYNFNDKYSPNATGLCVFFPQDNQSLEDWEAYIDHSILGDLDNIDFLADSSWDEFLSIYVSCAPIEEEPEINFVDVEKDIPYAFDFNDETEEIYYCTFEVTEPGIHNFTLNVASGEIQLAVYHYYGSSLGNNLYFLYSYAQNPEQTNKEQIIYWLNSGLYVIEILSWTSLASGSLTISQIEPTVLNLNEVVEGEFPIMRVATAPSMTIYNYFIIDLEVGLYDVMVNVSYPAALNLQIWDGNHVHPLNYFIGNAGDNYFHTLEATYERTILIEFGSYRDTGEFSIVISSYSTDTATKSASASFIGLLLLFVVAVTVYIRYRKKVKV